ncbi:UNVERIFIED_CONTAM: hypothetical protein FKN15_053596 [Acipenser sinensis]
MEKDKRLSWSRREGFGFKYHFEDDDAYDVDDSNDECSESEYCYSDYDPDYAQRSTYCGFPRAFLDPHNRPRSLDMNLPFNYKMGVTAEEAEKNAKELVDEEERVKQKAEKKRLKKKDQLDLTCSFVSKAASIAKRKMELKPKTEKKEKKKKPEKDTEVKQDVKQEIQENGNEDSDAILVKSFELAVIGNQLANSGRFELAVSYFTDAIKFNPKEYRLFGNRSFCYERLMQYDKALNDAEISLSMCSSWTKGYFRKGKALAGLKRYAEAVIALKEVLKLDNTCADAAQELMRVQIIQLMEMGFTREQSTNALIIHGTVHKALEALYNIHGNHLVIKENPVVAGNGHAVEEEWVVSGRKVHCAAKSVPRPEIPQITQLKPVFQPSATQANIQPGAGPINSVKMLYDRHCAFVNYSNKEAAERAIQTLQIAGAAAFKTKPSPPQRTALWWGISFLSRPQSVQKFGPQSTSLKSGSFARYCRTNTTFLPSLYYTSPGSHPANCVYFLFFATEILKTETRARVKLSVSLPH